MLQPGLSLPFGPAVLQVTGEAGYAVIPIEARVGGARALGLESTVVGRRSWLRVLRFLRC